MKAVIYDHYAGPEVLELADVAPPKMHVDSVLVRVHAAAVNPADVAEQVGIGVTDFKPATRSSATSARASPTSTAATPSRWQPSHTRSPRNPPTSPGSKRPPSP
jgi:hypothetical protein